MNRYEFIDHTADIIARAYGDTIEEAFASAARAMFDVITGGARIDAASRFEIEVESIDVEGLLVGFLSDLIVLHETEEVVLSRFEVEFDGVTKLRAVCHGEQFDRERHFDGTPVKGISYHLLEIETDHGDEPCHVQVLFDI